MTPAALARYVECLRRGGVLACPTETLVGLLADALSQEAVNRVVAIKRRGPDPIALILPDVHALELVAEPLSELALSLAYKHWPGPLTLIVRALPGLPAALVRNGTIGVRVPGPSPALELARAFGRPLTATSCNPSGQPAARTEAEVRAYFPNELDDIVPGDAPGGLPSTVLDATGVELKLIRMGAISLAE
jgi:tRNA threonylcarbamoyl adenosine modification protein (Sua5/YciO/YrdC/YwlC family)